MQPSVKEAVTVATEAPRLSEQVAEERREARLEDLQEELVSAIQMLLQTQGMSAEGRTKLQKVTEAYKEVFSRLPTQYSVWAVEGQTDRLNLGFRTCLTPVLGKDQSGACPAQLNLMVVSPI